MTSSEGLLLINDKTKLIGSFYKIDQKIIMYAFKTLKYNELKLFITLMGQANNFVIKSSSMFAFCGLTVEEYTFALLSLQEKEFINIKNEIITMKYENIIKKVCQSSNKKDLSYLL